MYTRSAIMFLLAGLVLVIVKLQQGAKPILPSANSPKGWLTRIALICLLAIMVSYLIYDAVLGGRAAIGLTLTTILVLVVLSTRIWGKRLRNKR